jgi:hypothetical protein
MLSECEGKDLSVLLIHIILHEFDDIIYENNK